MKIALVDNDDSFIHNLKQLFEQAGANDLHILNYRNARIENLFSFDKLVFGPGPGVPADYPEILGLIKEINSSKPVLGVCLGFQFIIEAFGGTLIRRENVKHGVIKEVIHKNNSVLFQNVPNPFKAGLYNSWVAYEIPEKISITSSAGDIPMSLEHNELEIKGVQFHPESFLTPDGKTIIRNWLFGS